MIGLVRRLGSGPPKLAEYLIQNQHARKYFNIEDVLVRTWKKTAEVSLDASYTTKGKTTPQAKRRVSRRVAGHINDARSSLDKFTGRDEERYDKLSMNHPEQLSSASNPHSLC